MISHYELLGIAPNANGATIRAAYIELMKRYHPDALGADAAGELGAREINRAFAVLRDPELRARYDGELEYMRQRALAGVRFRASTRHHHYPPALPSRRRYGRKIGALFAAFAFIGLVSFLSADDRPRPEFSFSDFSFAAPGVGLPDPVAEALDPTPGSAVPIDQWNIEDAVSDFDWVASTSQIEGATQYSQQCLDELATDPNLRLLDRCVAFDLAVGFWDAWRTEKDGTRADPYFSPAVMELRHARALRLIDDSDPRRLAEIEKSTISAMANLVITLEKPKPRTR